MKTLIPLTALAALAASGFSAAQTPAFSKPSGYTTQLLRPNATNYVGLNVLTPAIASGTVTALENSNFRLVDSRAGLLVVLRSRKMHTIEITSGTAEGHVREFVSWTNTGVNMSSPVSGLKIGDKYIIRENPTLQSIFNTARLTAAALVPTTADIIRVPNGTGGFLQYWYKNSTTDGPIGWWTTTDGTTRGVRVTADVPLLYTDGIQVLRKAGSNVNLVLTGQVKTTSSRPYVVKASNPISINPPVGATLSNTTMSGMTTHATSPATADVLFIPQSGGTFKRYWFKSGNTGGAAGWYETPDGIAIGTRIDATRVNLPPYCVINVKGTPKFIIIRTPQFYSSL